MKNLRHLNKYLYKYLPRILFGILFIIIANFFALIPARVIGHAFDLIKEDLAIYSAFANTSFKGMIYEIFTTALLLFGVLVLLLFPRSYMVFLIAGIIGGAAMGAIWTANRPMLIGLAPSVRIGQFFGFTELTDKFSGVIGPIVFGALVVWSGYTLALLSLIFFFVAGILFLLRVPDIRF